MGMGEFGAELRADDLYVLARSPAAQLGAVMRFVTCGANLSLDTMQRVGVIKAGLDYKRAYTLQFVDKKVGVELRPK